MLEMNILNSALLERAVHAPSQHAPYHRSVKEAVNFLFFSMLFCMESHFYEMRVLFQFYFFWGEDIGQKRRMAVCVY